LIIYSRFSLIDLTWIHDAVSEATERSEEDKEVKDYETMARLCYERELLDAAT